MVQGGPGDDRASTTTTALTAANAAGGQGTAAGDAAFEASLVTRFNTNYNRTSTTFWNTAPSNPTSVTMFGNSNTYTRPGTAYLALRAILGKDNYNAVVHDIQHAYSGGSMTEEELKKEFHKWMPKKSAGLLTTSSTRSSSSGGTRPTRVPRRRATSRRSRAPAWPAAASTTPRRLRGLRRRRPGAGRRHVPPTLGLTLGAPATFGAFTPGVAKDYTASTTATVISTAGDAALTVTDPAPRRRATWSTARSRCRRR